jgi:nicotinamide mononucleotide transporter
MWRRNAQGLTPRVGRTPPNAWLALLAAILFFTGLIGGVFDQFTDNPLPYWDAVTVALSLVAQYALTRKWLENWFIWIIANVIYIGLGVSAQSYQFAALQLVYIALSLMGYRHWMKDLA